MGYLLKKFHEFFSCGIDGFMDSLIILAFTTSDLAFGKTAGEHQNPAFLDVGKMGDSLLHFGIPLLGIL